MANSTSNGSSTAIRALFCRTGLGINQKMFLLSVNIALSITAFLGNALIIAALRTVSSLHSPSKVLLGCLACTDLCVGLITQHLYVTYLLTPGRSIPCFYLEMIFYITAAQFGGASLLTLTAISVDRLKVQTGCNFETSTILGCCCLAFKHCSCNDLHSSFSFCDAHHLYSDVTMYSNFNLLLHENISCTSSTPNSSTRSCSPGSTEQRRTSIEYGTIHKDGVQRTVGAYGISGLLCSVSSAG